MCETITFVLHTDMWAMALHYAGCCVPLERAGSTERHRGGSEMMFELTLGGISSYQKNLLQRGAKRLFTLLARDTGANV